MHRGYDKKFKYLKERWKKLEEGMFGFGNKSKIETPESVSNKIKQAVDDTTFRYFSKAYGSTFGLAFGMMGLFGLDNYPREGAIRTSDKSPEEKEILIKMENIVRTFWWLFVGDDSLRIDASKILKSNGIKVNPMSVTENLKYIPSIHSYMETLSNSGIEDMDNLPSSEFSKIAREWLEFDNEPIRPSGK